MLTKDSIEPDLITSILATVVANASAFGEALREYAYPEPGLGGYSTFALRKGFFSLAGNNLHPMWQAFLASFPDEEARAEACEYATFATDTIVTIVSHNDGDTELWICHEGSGKIVVNSDAAGTDWKWGLPE